MSLSFLNPIEIWNNYQLLKEFRALVLQFKQLENCLDYKCQGDILNKISNFYNNHSLQNEITNELDKENFIAILSNYLNKFEVLGYFSSEDVRSCTNNIMNCLIICCLYNRCCAVQCLNSDIPRLLIDIILNKQFAESSESKHMETLVSIALRLMNNIIMYPGNEWIFQTNELKKILLDMIERNHSNNISILSSLSLCYLVNDCDLSLLEEDKNYIVFLTDIIKECYQNKSDDKYGITIIEIVKGLKYLTTNDNMKKPFVKANGITTMINYTTNLEISYEVLWNLCFDDEIRPEMINYYDLNIIMKFVRLIKSRNIDWIYHGIIWQTEFKYSSREERILNNNDNDNNKKFKFDIFLSYFLDNKEIILKIKRELKKLKLKLWIDIDEMKGKINFDSIGDGIEKSKIFLMLVSSAYQKCPHCRTVAQYAYLWKKPIIPIINELNFQPMNWINVYTNNKICYQFTEERSFNDSMKELINEIKSLL